MSHLLIFIDTEFTDFKDSKLISLGCVSDEDDELYLEVTHPHNECSDFVKMVVWPLLWHSPDVTVSTLEIKDRIIDWLEKVRKNRDVVICFDYITDWALFGEAIDFKVPEWMHYKHITHNNFLKSDVDAYMDENGLPKHHALYDARGNKHAFMLQQKRQKRQ